MFGIGLCALMSFGRCYWVCLSIRMRIHEGFDFVSPVTGVKEDNSCNMKLLIRCFDFSRLFFDLSVPFAFDVLF